MTVVSNRTKNSSFVCGANRITLHTISDAATGVKQYPNTQTDWKNDLQLEYVAPWLIYSINETDGVTLCFTEIPIWVKVLSNRLTCSLLAVWNLVSPPLHRSTPIQILRQTLVHHRTDCWSYPVVLWPWTYTKLAVPISPLNRLSGNILNDQSDPILWWNGKTYILSVDLTFLWDTRRGRIYCRPPAYRAAEIWIEW